VIAIEIPGWGYFEIEHIVLDLNGTIATDGKIPSKLKERINSVANKASLYIVTADTQETADEEVKGLNVKLVRVSGEESKKAKSEFLKTLDPETTVAIGNGSNDEQIFREAGLAIAVIGEEGLSTAAMKSADVVVKDVSSAFDLLLKPKRLVATLRE
jgi:soluble P-type ATPase